MVFGRRSGQMFPRQRAFHDAIYEEECGSDQDEECCQGRGMSAIFCWFLSVIIIIGLAASIVLTVFFLFKSKNYSKTEELDLLFEGDNGINFHLPESSTPGLNNLNVVPSSKESIIGKSSGEETGGKYRKQGSKFSKVSTTTKFPPSRKGPHQIFQESSEEESLPFQPLYPNGKYSSAERRKFMNKESTSSASEEDHETLTLPTTSTPTTTTTQTPNQYVLFTSPPLVPTTGTPRRNLQTTRFPTGRTSFTTSTEALDRNDEDESDENESSSTTVHSQSTSNHPEKENRVNGEDESKLKKMLVGEIPPHSDRNESSEFVLPSTASPLAKIIKTLAPKWIRNRTIETTTMSSGAHKYDFTISSRESPKETHGRPPPPPTTMKDNESAASSSKNKTGFDEVESPDLSQKTETNGDSPFLDVLVGNDDHKTLVTKETKDGIFTSVILPPWYDSPNDNSSLITLSTAAAAAAAAAETEADHGGEESESHEEAEEAEKEKDNDSSASSTVLGGIFNFFKKFPLRNDNSGKRVVLKRPNGPLRSPSSEETHYPTSSPIPTMNSSSSATTDTTGLIISTESSSSIVVDDIRAANNAFHIGSSDGVTNIYGYYPDEDDKANDKTVESHMIQSESISDPNQLLDQAKGDHSVELQIHSDTSSEVVGDDEYSPYNTPRYGESSQGSVPSSQVRNKIVPPPLPTMKGGGIRRPITISTTSSTTTTTFAGSDMEMKATENKPIFSNLPQRNSVRTQFIRQRGNVNGSKDLSLVSEEVGDNSRQQDTAAAAAAASTPLGDKKRNFKRKSHKPETGKNEKSEEAIPVSSVELAGVDKGDDSRGGAPHNKWSRPDPNSMEGYESSEEGDDDGAAESPVGAASEETGNSDPAAVIERRPVSQVAELHYPDTSVAASNEDKKVFQVYPEGYNKLQESSTTEEPTISAETSIAEPEKSGGGFVPPKPVNFHEENVYTYTPPKADDATYQSKDGWRPILYKSGEDGGSGGQTAPGDQHLITHHNPGSLSFPTTMGPLLWREKLMRRPVITVSPELELTTPATTVPSAAALHSSQQSLSAEEEDNEGNVENDNRHASKEKHGGGSLWEPNQQLQEHNPLSKVRFPHHNSHEVHDQVGQQSQQHQNFYPQQPQQQQPFQHVPIQLQHPPPTPHQRQQHFHQFPSNPNIDRMKYMRRPAAPPILMRRSPGMNHPFLQQNSPRRPQLIPQLPPSQQQQQQQQLNNPPPPEFDQRLINRKRFKTLGGSPRGNINWPEKEVRRVHEDEDGRSR